VNKSIAYNYFFPFVFCVIAWQTFGIVIYKYFCFNVTIILSTVISTSASAVGIYVVREGMSLYKNKKKAKQD